MTSRRAPVEVPLSRIPLLLLCSTLLACVGSGDLPARVSGQVVDEYEQPLGPGLIMVEQGRVHAGSYILGTLIDEQGRWEVELPAGGIYGIHLFVDGYQYLPAEIEIDDHQQVVLTSMMISWGVWMDLTGLFSWPTQPDDATLVRMPIDETEADNPVLNEIEIRWEGDDMLSITADVSDPNGDLSRMILAYDEATGAGYALNPPSSPEAGGAFPNGIYTMRAFADELHEPGLSVWRFVVSDNLCNDTPITKVVMPPR